MRILCCLLMAFVLFFTACSESPSVATPTARTEAKPLEALTPEIEAQILTIGKTFASAVNAQDLDKLEELIDMQGLYYRCLKGVKVPEEFERAIATRDAKSIIRNVVGVRMAVIRPVLVEGQPGCLLRVTSPQMVDYMTVVLDMEQKTVIDLKVFSSGMWMSELGKEALVQLVWPELTEEEQSKLKHLTNGRSTRQLVADFWQLGKIGEAVQNGDGALALREWDRLSPEQKTRKNIMMVRIKAATILGEDSEDSIYYQACKEFAETFPDDPSLPLLMFSNYMVQENFSAAHEAVETLNELVQDEEFLTLQHSYIYLRRGRIAAAKTIAEDYVRANPDIIDGWEYLLEATFTDGDFARLAEAADVLEQSGEDYSHLLTDPWWQSFADSPEGRRGRKNGPRHHEARSIDAMSI